MIEIPRIELSSLTDCMHAAMKEKYGTASNTEKLQILTLVPDPWSQKCCCEYFGVSEYIV